MEMRSHKGFTLIELIIVLAIMGILAAIAAPSLRGYMAQRRLNGAVRVLYGDLTDTRTQAISRNQWVALNIDSDRQYTIFHDNNQNGTVDTGELITTRNIATDYYDVVFSTPPGTVITFYANGTGSTGTLSLTGSTGSKSVTISSNGRVRIN